MAKKTEQPEEIPGRDEKPAEAENMSKPEENPGKVRARMKDTVAYRDGIYMAGRIYEVGRDFAEKNARWLEMLPGREDGGE